MHSCTVTHKSCNLKQARFRKNQYVDLLRTACACYSLTICPKYYTLLKYLRQYLPWLSYIFFQILFIIFYVRTCLCCKQIAGCTNSAQNKKPEAVKLRFCLQIYKICIYLLQFFRRKFTAGNNKATDILQHYANAFLMHHITHSVDMCCVLIHSFQSFIHSRINPPAFVRWVFILVFMSQLQYYVRIPFIHIFFHNQ